MPRLIPAPILTEQVSPIAPHQSLSIQAGTTTPATPTRFTTMAHGMAMATDGLTFGRYSPLVFIPTIRVIAITITITIITGTIITVTIHTTTTATGITTTTLVGVIIII